MTYNRACTRSADCVTNQECDDGFCVCFWQWGMDGETCNVVTSNAIMPLIARPLMIAFYAVSCLLALQLLILERYVQRANGNGGQCTCYGGGFSVSTLWLAALGGGMSAAHHAILLVQMFAPAGHPSERPIYNLMEAFGGGFCILSFLNVGLMWIDICIATKRLQSNNLRNLRHTRLRILSFMTLYAVCIGVFNAGMLLDDIYPWCTPLAASRAPLASPAHHHLLIIPYPPPPHHILT